MVRGATVLIVVSAVALWPGRASAQPPAWTLQWENDVVFGSDDDYTNGLRLSADFSKAIWWKRWGLGYNDCKDEKVSSKPCLRTTLMFGQSFYTPHDITVKQVLEGERPYAAWLYGGFAARAARETRLTSVELEIGTTGTAAFGKQVQTWFHSLPGMNSPQPQGWRNQVKPVPGLVGVIASWDDKFAFPSIRRAVADGEVGFEIGCRRLSGGFRWVWRSPEFDGAGVSKFGGLFITLATKGP